MLTIAQSPTDPAFVADPYPVYAAMRAAGDLVYWRDYDLVCATTHRAVSRILRDRRFGREVPAEVAPDIPDHLEAFYAVEAHSMLELEPPRHTRLRGLVLRAFTSSRIAGLAPEIAALCDTLIDRFPASGRFDLIDAYCRPLPVIVICRLLGVPEAMAAQLLAWSGAMVAMYQARRDRAIEDAAARAARDFAAFIRDQVSAKRRAPGDDLLSELIAARDRDDRLSDDELVTTAILLLNAGHEATVHSLGNGLFRLLRDAGPAPRRTDRVVEEILRHDPPLHLFTRYAYAPVALFGHDFARGDRVGLLLGSAGRDDAVWDAPDRFRHDRPSRPVHLSFGAGTHFCVGAPLARLEMACALTRLQMRCPGLKLAETPRYADLYHFHGLTGLLVTRG